MARTFIKARLTDGREVVSSFGKLGNGLGSKYAQQVFSGSKPFNVWQIVSEIHPQSGEKIAFRSREMVRPQLIESLTVVKPKAGFEASHQYVADNFEPAVTMSKGPRGIYVVPATPPTGGLTAGTQYPKHRDPGTFREYIILRAAEGEQSEARYYLDGRGEGSSTPMTAATSEDDFDGADLDEE